MPVINNTDTLLVRGNDGKFIPIAVIKGDPGRGVLSVIRTEGDGSPGSTDVYTITFTDGGTTQFTVYNGRNGGSDIPPEIIADIVKQYFEENPIDPAEIGAVSADQGVENADRILGIGEDGKVIPVDKPQGDVKTVAGVKPDASGNVPLTASDVGASPGVYYGSDEPSEEYDVWIDPNGNESGGGSSAEGAVLYTAQALTEEQQNQARDNIGAAPMSLFKIVGDYTVERDLLEPEKLTPGYKLIDGKRYQVGGSWAVTDFIDISDVTRIFCYFYEGSESKFKLPIICFYSNASEDKFIVSRGGTTEYDFTKFDGISCVEIEKPEDAKYMMLSFATSDTNSAGQYRLMLEKTAQGGVMIPDLIVPEENFETINGIVADNTNVIWTRGYLKHETGEFVAAGSGSDFNTTDFIQVPSGRYRIEASGIKNEDSGEIVNGIYHTCVYNQNKEFVQYLSNVRVIDFSLTDEINYIRVTVQMRTIEHFALYDLVIGKENVTALKESVLIPRLDAKVDDSYNKLNRVGAKDTGYVRGRRPLVAFIFDGDWDLNATYEEMFWRHKIPIGFAIQYNTAFKNNSKEQYLAWERKGHEILTHGAYILKMEEDGGSVTSVDQGKQYIKESYITMRNNGFNPLGYVASNGELDGESYIPTLKRYYEWAATVYNHAGTSQSHYVFGETKPYELWRYNMELSSLDQMKQAIDDTIATNSVLVFFGHAESDRVGEGNHFTLENMEALFAYIETKEIDVVRPSEAIKDFFSVRYEEFLGL